MIRSVMKMRRAPSALSWLGGCARCACATPAARRLGAVLLSAALAALSPSPAAAQSGLPNPSFEQGSGIPSGYGQISLATPWQSATLASPDYFHALAAGPSGMGVPANDFGNQVPLTGQAYAGFHARPNNPYREYVESPLSTPLVAGQTYLVSFAVSLCDRCDWAVDRIGAHLSAGPVGPVNTAYTLPGPPQINHPFGSPVTNKAGWTVVSGSYVAVGGEDHIVIGNFFDDPTTMLLTGQGGPYGFAYYYLDDVSVTLATSPCATPPAGMVAWYPLDELTGATTVVDIAPPPASLVNNVGLAQPGPVGPPGPGNGPPPVAGMVGGAHYFYPGHFHSVAGQAELDFGTGDFSVDAWIRVVANGPLPVQGIVDKLDIPGGNVGFSLYIQDKLLKLNLNGSTFSSASSITNANPMANTGLWYHVAATVSRSTGVGMLYFNGLPDVPSFAPSPASVTNGLPLWIGESRLPNSVGEIAVDELEIFNRALTPQEVMGIFAAGPAGKCKLDKADLGDAPDSSNHIGTTMTSYAIGNFPTVHDPPSPGPAGPLHRDAKGLLWLGPNVSFEGEADVGWDQDPTNNLLATGSPPTADHDLLDDGVAGVPLPHCAITQFPLGASSASTASISGYLNVWLDWTRDGDWDDIPRCAVAPNVDAIAAEWAVQNQVINLAPGFNPALMSAPFRSLNPAPGGPTWMRVSLTDAPISAASHGGPFPNPADLGRGGSGPAGGYPFGETEDYLLVGPSGGAEVCVLKFHDLDGDGVQDPGEPGLPGWQIDILDASGNVVTTLTTGPQGTFCVGVPAPAPYTVAEVMQPGWMQTFPAPPGTHSLSAVPGQLVNLSFGNRRPGGRIYVPIVYRAAPAVPLTPATSVPPTAVPTIPGVSTPSPHDTARPTATAPPTVTPSPTPTETLIPTPTPTDVPTASATFTPVPQPPTLTASATPTREEPPSPTLTLTASRPTDTVPPTPGCAPPPAGMSAWWPLDELIGLTAVDGIGGHHGAVQGGAAVLIPAKVLAGRAFDGTSGHIVVPHAPALDPGAGDLSIDAWIRPRALDGRRPILTKTYAPADAPLGYAFSLEGGQLTFSLSNEASAVVGTAPAALTVDGQWHLVAATLDRGSTTGGRLYLDGALIHAFDPTPLVGPIDTLAELWIGGVTALGRGLAARFFDGGIDEVELFGRSLSEAEIRAIYTAGPFGKCDKPAVREPLGWWSWPRRGTTMPESSVSPR